MKKKKPAQKHTAAAKKKAPAKTVSKKLVVAKPSTRTHEVPVTQVKKDLTMIFLFAAIAVVALLGLKYSGIGFEQVEYLFRF